MFHLKCLLFSTTALTLLCLFIVFDLNTLFVLKLRYPFFLPLLLEIRGLLYKPGWPQTHQGQPASACWGLRLKVCTMPSHTITFNHHIAFNLFVKLVAFCLQSSSRIDTKLHCTPTHLTVPLSSTEANLPFLLISFGLFTQQRGTRLHLTLDKSTKEVACLLLTHYWLMQVEAVILNVMLYQIPMLFKF